MNEHIECQWENCSGGQFCKKHSLEQALCPLTNSSHEKALVRVVEQVINEPEPLTALIEVIQVLCACGKIISEEEIKSK